MATRSCCILLLTVYLLPSGSRGQDWGYSGDHGPDRWAASYPACSGPWQSPIDVRTADTVYDEALAAIPITYTGPRSRSPTLTNGGHNVFVDLIPDAVTLTGGGLPAPYRTVQLHFHWANIPVDGADQVPGSEHRIDGKTFAMELHFVHYSSVYGRNVTRALLSESGLVVLVVLVQLCPLPNPAFDPLVEGLTRDLFKGETRPLEEFDFQSLLPADLQAFYMYRGSLTTPPCLQSVLWLLLHQQVCISPHQLNAFRNLRPYPRPGSQSRDQSLGDNIRPVQPINDRIVLRSTPRHSLTGGPRN